VIKRRIRPHHSPFFDFPRGREEGPAPHAAHPRPVRRHEGRSGGEGATPRLGDAEEKMGE
jgi:hypothetical protein